MHQSSRPLVIGAVIFAAVFGLGALLLLSTGGGEPPAAPPAPTAAKPSATAGTPTAAPGKDAVLAEQGDTVLLLRFSGQCDGCLVSARQTDNADGQQEWTATIENGQAQLELPSPNTYGLNFTVKGVSDGEENNTRQLVVLAPKGTPAGSGVQAADLKKVKQGTVCWAGTTLDTATLQLSVTADNGKVNRAWADPALATIGKPVALADTGTATASC